MFSSFAATMKIFKFRLRSFALLTVLLTLTLFLLNLSPSAVSQHFFRLSATDGLPSARNQSQTASATSKRIVYPDPFKQYDLRVGQAASQEKDVANSSRQEEAEGGGPGGEAGRRDAATQQETKQGAAGEPGGRARERQEPRASSRDGLDAPKTNGSRQVDEAGGSYVRQGIAEGEEHDAYVQDYPDYTPAEFVEVLKTKLSSKVKKPARISGKGRDLRRPPDDKFSREALRARALEFPEKTVRNSRLFSILLFRFVWTGSLSIFSMLYFSLRVMK